MFNPSPNNKYNYQSNGTRNQDLSSTNFSQINFDNSNMKVHFPDLINYLRTINNNEINFYEFMALQRKRFKQQQKANRQKMLEENYPVKFVIGYATFVGAICIVLIALQIVLMINKYYLYYIGTGLWISAYFMILISLFLVISKYKYFFSCMLLKQSIF